MSDWIHKTAAELADALASGETTSVELTRAHLDRIDAVDGDVHAFLHVDGDGALAQAAASDGDGKRIEGAIASRGIAVGRVVHWSQPEIPVIERGSGEAGEATALDRALEKVGRMLRSASDSAR